MSRKIGYVRISTDCQTTARQDVLMEQLGVDMVYTDIFSGKSVNRPQLQAMIDGLEPGDTVIVESYSRLARSTVDLITLVDQFQTKGVTFISKKEAIDTTTAAGRLMMTFMAGIAQFERECTLERSAEGIRVRQSKGLYSGEHHKGKLRQAVDAELFESCYKKCNWGLMTQKEAAALLGLKQEALSRRFAERRMLGAVYDPNKARSLQQAESRPA